MTIVITVILYQRTRLNSNKNWNFFDGRNIKGENVMAEMDKTRGLYSHNQELNKITIESTVGALLKLMENKNYYEISVTEICEKAGISRNAFYKNFGTKDNVFKRLVVDFNKEIVKTIGSPFNIKVNLAWYQQFFKLIERESKILKLLIASSFQNIYLETVNKILTTNTNLDAETKYKRIMWNGAIQNIVTNWIKSDMKESSEEIARICYDKLKYINNKENQIITFLKRKISPK